MATPDFSLHALPYLGIIGKRKHRGFFQIVIASLAEVVMHADEKQRHSGKCPKLFKH